MIIWGGVGASYFGDGARYNPAANSWTSVATLGAPAAREFHTAVWTGGEMIVWGGFGPTFFGGLSNDGGRYNPLSDTWTPVTTVGAPAVRTRHTAVWTGKEMIVWGGLGANGRFNDTFSYTPTRTLYLYLHP